MVLMLISKYLFKCRLPADTELNPSIYVIIPSLIVCEDDFAKIFCDLQNDVFETWSV